LDDLKPAAPPPWIWNLLVVTTYVPIALGSVLWWLWRGEDAEVWLQVCGYFPFRDAALGVAIGLLLVLFTRLMSPIFAFARRLEDALISVIGPISLLTCFVLALASSIGEEFLFRGVIQPELGLVLTSILFAAVHVPIERALWPWPIFALGMGLLLGAFYDWSGSLPGPVAVHFTINFLNLRWLSRRAAQG
jgi:membrane protease YdiL (CAAX protease family)